jgi:sulfide:quinone oxidoreductase
VAHVLVLGGGFGGLSAAHELRSALGDGHDVTLVARSDRFFMGFAKLWDLAGSRPLEEGSRPLSRLEGAGIRFVQADVTGIDHAACSVETSEGPLTGDALVIALGVVPKAEHAGLLDRPGAHNLYDAAALPAMRDALDGVEDGRVVVSILGGPFQCPPAPFEAALIVDERLRQRGVRDRVEVAVSTPAPMTIPAAGPDASRYVASFLAERGVELLTEQVLRPDEAGATVFLGVPAAAAPPVLAAGPLVGPSGWIEPDARTLRTGFERVYAVGDCTHIPNAIGALPKAGVFAAAEGVVAARNVAADLGVAEPATFDGYGSCFLELPGSKVAVVEGDFLAEPRPAVTLSEATEENYRRKLDFERERLDAWLG